MALFEVTDYDRKVWEEELKDFLPEKILDVHTHVYKREFIEEDAPPADVVKRTVTWTSTVAKEKRSNILLILDASSARTIMSVSPSLAFLSFRTQ